MNASRHEVMALVAQHANELGRQRGIEDRDRRFGVAAIAFGHGAAGNVSPRALAQRLDDGQEWLLIRPLCIAQCWFLGHDPSPRRCMCSYSMRYAPAPLPKPSRIRAGEAEQTSLAYTRGASGSTPQRPVQFLQCGGKSL